MGMLDILKQGVGMLGNPNTQGAIAYLQARRMGMNPMEAMSQWQQMTNMNRRTALWEEQMRQQEEDRKRQEEERGKAQGQDIINRAIFENISEKGTGWLGATPEQQMAGLMQRGVDPQTAKSLIPNLGAGSQQSTIGSPLKLDNGNYGIAVQGPNGPEIRDLGVGYFEALKWLKENGANFAVDATGNIVTVPSQGAAGPQALEQAKTNVSNRDVETAGATARETAIGKSQGTDIAGASGVIKDVSSGLSLIRELISDPGVENAYGTIQGRTPTIRQKTADFEAKRNRMVDMLGLAARGQMKGTGQISDFESKMLLRSQSILADPLISPAVAKEEMRRVEEWMLDKAMNAVILNQQAPAYSAPQGGGTVLDWNALPTGQSGTKGATGGW